jgi:hypothetical protein
MKKKSKTNKPEPSLSETVDEQTHISDEQNIEKKSSETKKSEERPKVSVPRSEEELVVKTSPKRSEPKRSEPKISVPRDEKRLRDNKKVTKILRKSSPLKLEDYETRLNLELPRVNVINKIFRKKLSEIKKKLSEKKEEGNETPLRTPIKSTPREVDEKTEDKNEDVIDIEDNKVDVENDENENNRDSRYDENEEDEDREEDEDDEDKPPQTEEEMVDEYKMLLQRLKRHYPYLDITIPPNATSQRLKRMYRFHVDEVSSAEGLYKYYWGMLIGFCILEMAGRKMGLPCQDYAEIQMNQISNYNSLLVEFGDRDYFGFTRSWPIEVRIIGLMLVNFALLVIARLLIDPNNIKSLFGMMTNSRSTPAIHLDNETPTNNPESTDPGLNAIGTLLGGGTGAGTGGANGIGSMLSMLMNAFGGGGGPPPRERQDQARPTYQRRRRPQVDAS